MVWVYLRALPWRILGLGASEPVRGCSWPALAALCPGLIWAQLRGPQRASPNGSTHVVGPNQCLNQCVGCAMEASHDRQLTIWRLQLATTQPYPTLTSHALVDSFGHNFSII